MPVMRLVLRVNPFKMCCIIKNKRIYLPITLYNQQENTNVISIAQNSQYLIFSPFFFTSCLICLLLLFLSANPLIISVSSLLSFLYLCSSSSINTLVPFELRKSQKRFCCKVQILLGSLFHYLLYLFAHLLYEESKTWEMELAFVMKGPGLDRRALLGDLKVIWIFSVHTSNLQF